MPDVNQTRRRFTVVLTILLLLDVAAAAVLVSPIGRGARSGQAQLQKLWAALRVKDREVVPLRGIDQKVLQAKQEIQDFYAVRFSSSYAAISEQLGKVAAANGVKIASARYKSEAAPVPDLERVSIEVGITADYAQAVKFVNALERDKMFFLVTSVGLQGQKGGSVRLQLHLETYLRSASSSVVSDIGTEAVGSRTAG